MFPIIKIPPIVSGVSSYFSLIFHERQMKHFCEYETGLIVSENTTIDAMNKLFLNGNDQSSLNKFLTLSDWDENELNNKRLELLQTRKKTRWKSYGIIAIDDTILHKTGKDMEGADWFFDHSTGKMVLGHNIVTAHYMDDLTSYPIDYRLYHKEGSEIALKEGFRTKIELAKELINDCVDRDIPVNILVFDRWFVCGEITDLLQKYDKIYISPLKSNMRVMRDGVYIPLKEYVARVNNDDYEEIEVGKKRYLVYTKRTRLPNAGRARLVISCPIDENGKITKDMLMFFATNKLEWEPKKILKMYMKRWRIEVFYRDTKQALGLESYQVRKLKAIKRHWYLVFMAYSLLKLGVKQSGLGKLVSARTIGEACRNVVMGSLKSFVGWVYEKFVQNARINDVMDVLMLKIAKV